MKLHAINTDRSHISGNLMDHYGNTLCRDVKTLDSFIAW